MFPDFKDLLSALNAHRVRYLVVGGYAVSFHAQPRATRDLDLLISATAENGRAVYAALMAFGAPLQGLTAEDLIEPGSFFRMGSPPVMVDILPRISGVEFDEAWQRRVEVEIDEALSAPFISREDLIAAKLAAGRPQDLADAVALSEEPHKVREQQLPYTAAAPDALEEMRKKGRDEWLQLHQASIETPEETRAKAREQWRTLRQQQAETSDTSEAADTTRSDELRRTELTEDLDPGFDDEPLA